MPRYTILYARLPNEEVERVNAEGWDSSAVAKAYLGVTMFPKREAVLQALLHGVYELAATVEASDHEDLFARMQNLESSWVKDPAVQEVHTDFPRSMSVGDLVHELESGQWRLCASIGFDRLIDPLTINRLDRLVHEARSAES